MNKIIHKLLSNLEGNLISIQRNTVDGWYELEVGIPNGWVYKTNDIIECETINKTDNGILLKIKPKDENVVIDDLIDFANLIIETNAKIVEKEREFNEKMNKYKKELEEQAKKFYDELDTIKENSFTKFDKPKKSISPSKTTTVVENDQTKKTEENIDKKSGPGRPKGSKNVKTKDEGGESK